MPTHVHVVLQETVRNVGASGEIVRVRPGFARNYLLPRQLAVMATESNVAQVEHHKRMAQVKAAKEKATAGDVAQKLQGLVLKIARSSSEEDRLFGSVTSKDIAAALASHAIEVDRRKIELSAPIRHLGLFDVSARLGHEVHASFKVEVVKAS